MLRLKGEADDEILDEEPALSDRITARDAFPEEPREVDGEDLGEEPRRGTSLLRGLGIATATFVPTLLAIVFGLPYLLDSSVPERAPSAPTAADLGAPATAPRSETIRDPFVPPRVVEPAPRAADPRESARLRELVPGSIGESAPPKAVEPPPSTPTLPPSQAPPAEARSADSRPVEPREPEPSASAPRPAPERSPAAEPRKSAPDAPDWAPAAAFT
ncbi:MAG: hypothetical protein ACRELW_14260, partial [Candidatus Rokuibacteriota bacterium]